MKNFKGVRSFRSDIKPEFRFYSAELGHVVAVTVEYKAGNGRNVKRGYYLELTKKELTADGGVIWMPLSAPRTAVLLAETARFSLPVLTKYAALFDAVLPELVNTWAADRAAAEALICSVAFEAVA